MPVKRLQLAATTVDAHRQNLIRVARDVNGALGISDGPRIPLGVLRGMMLADGVKPEDNAFSNDVIRARRFGSGA